jgi:hypothetical protein
VHLLRTVLRTCTLAQIDARALGISREKHHRFLIGDNRKRGVALYTGDDCVGYAYVSAGGHVGPFWCPAVSVAAVNLGRLAFPIGSAIWVLR